MQPVEVSAGIGALIVQAAAARGVPAADLQAATGFDPALASDPDARIPLEVETALWEEAARRARDPAFGLHAAQSLKPGVFDVLDYVFRTAPTVRASLERVSRYNRLLHDIAAITIVDRGPLTRLEHRLTEPGATQSRHAAEFTLAGIVVVATQMAERPLLPGRVGFHHPAPDADVLREHRHLFGVEPSFDQPANVLEFDTGAVTQPVPRADPMLSRVVVRHAEAMLTARPAPAETIANRLRRLLSTALADEEGGIPLTEAAARLHMSERTLQRRLANEGLTYDQLLEDLRRDLALRYLQDPRVAIAQVAYLLGYSEPSAFHRAFKRWTGKTPTEVRQGAG